ncbi:MAG: metallophosphoesterase [candidate division Zixibacteria bacterium]|nr:metallophosphoesterase [candidate division Zixibacteria bacterium]
MTRPWTWRLAGLLTLLLAASAVPPAAANPDDMTPVRFAVIGDRTGGHVPGIYEQVVDEVARLRPDFIMTVGDMIEGSTEDSIELAEQWQEYRYLISPLVAPIHFTPGDHELFCEAAQSAYEENVGRTYYSFNFDKVHVVVLDVSRWESASEMPPEQINWMERDLKTFKNSDYTLVFMHKPFWWETIVHNQPDTLHDLFKKYGVDAVFSGHYHQYFSVDYQGIKYTCLGSSGSMLGDDFGSLGHHFLYVTLDKRGIHIAPIKMGAVQSWDVMTIVDRKVYQALRSKGLTFTHPIPVTDDLKISHSTVQFTVDNSVGNYPVTDTLRWNCPAEYHLSPKTLEIYVPAHDKRTYSLSLSCSHASFPPPVAELKFRYGKENVMVAREPLPLARTANCARVVEGLSIDGLLSENVWTEPETKYFDQTGKRSSVEPTEVYFAYDDHNLYLAARCQESAPGSMSVKAVSHDGPIANDDHIGFFIAPPGEQVRSFQIYFNPDGVAFDQCFEQDPDGLMHGDRSWNGNFEVKTQRFADGWTLEARIPLASFGARMAPGDRWRVNFNRKQTRVTGSAEWQTPTEHDPDTYGILVVQ